MVFFIFFFVFKKHTDQFHSVDLRVYARLTLTEKEKTSGMSETKAVAFMCWFWVRGKGGREAK